MNEFATKTEEQFFEIRETMSAMATKQDLASLESKVDGLESRFDGLESQMLTVDKMAEMEGRLATKFVTKVYLDEKLANQTVEIFERLDRRLGKDRDFKETLVGTLSRRSLIDNQEAGNLRELI